MAISAQQAFALVDRVFKRITSQLMSSPSIQGLGESGGDEFMRKCEEEIVTAILVDGRMDKHKAMVFLGLDSMDELYLFLVYCKGFCADGALWDRYVAAYSIDGKNQYLNTTWVSLLYYLANEDSELTSELEDKSNEFFPKPEPEPKPEPKLKPEPEFELEFEPEPEPKPEPEPNKNSGKLVAANSLVPDSFPSKAEKAGWYGIVDAMLGLANVFSALYSVIPIVVKKIEHLTVSTKPGKKSEPRSDAAIVTVSQSSTSTTEKTTVDSQNIFGMFGKILHSAFSLTTVPGVLGVECHDSGNKRPGPTPAA